MPWDRITDNNLSVVVIVWRIIIILWWETTHHHTAKMVSDQHQWCCSDDTMLPPVTMNMHTHHTTLKDWLNTMLLRYTSKKTGRVILAAFQHHGVRGCPILPSTFTTSLSHSASSSYFVFIKIRGLSCDFVNYLMKFTNWQERKTDLFLNNCCPFCYNTLPGGSFEWGLVIPVGGVLMMG